MPPDDASVDAEGDAGDVGVGSDGGTEIDGGPGPSGVFLVRSPRATISVQGVTSDGYAIYLDSASNTLHAVAIAAGAEPVTIATVDATVVVAVQGEAALFWTQVDSSGIGALAAWTKANGVHALSTASLTGATAIAGTSDGADIVYFDAASGAAGLTSIAVASSATGDKTTLVSGVSLTNPGCAPNVAYAGAFAIAAYCLAEADAGPGATVVSYRGATWTPTTLATGALATSLVTNSRGTSVLVTTPDGLVVYPLAGGPGTSLDPAGSMGLFTSDGARVVYTTTTDALKVSPVGAPLPVTLVPTGLEGVVSLSPDNAWALGYAAQNPQNVMLSDLYLASATTPGVATTLSATSTAIVLGSGFTADASHALYTTSYDLNVGTLHAAPTAGGGPPTVLGAKVFFDYPTSGAKVVFNANWAPNAANGVADLEAVDTSRGVEPAILVGGADAQFYVSADATKIVYSWSFTPGVSSGLWVLPAP